MQYVAGVDIGGTKVDLIFFDKNLKKIEKIKLYTKELPTGSLALLDSLLSIIYKKVKNESLIKLAIAINAAVKKNIILKSSILGVDNFDIVKYIRKKKGFQNAKIIVENDVIAAARAELRFGWGKKIKSFVLLNIGTGIRLAYCSDDYLVTGYNNCAGEISALEIYIDKDKKIFLEEIISGRGVSNIYSSLSNKNLEAADVFKQKNIYSNKTLILFKSNLLFLFQLIAFFYNPEVLIVTGSIFKSRKLFLKEVHDDFLKKTDKFFHFSLLLSKLKDANIKGVLLKE